MTFVNNLHQGLVPGIQPLANKQLFCIAIGYSAGGFEAVKELLCSLPATNNNFSIVLSQSLEDSQFHALACLLSANLLWDMHRPEEGEMVMPGLIYAAIPGEAILIAYSC